MSYYAIVPSQDVFSGIDLDGNFDFIGQTPTNVGGVPATGLEPTIHAFVNDHPFDPSKQSYRVTGFGGGSIETSNIRASYNGLDGFGVAQNTTLTGGGRNTFEFWFKYTTLNNRVPQFANNGVIAAIFANDSGLERQAIEIRLLGGNTFGTNNAGALSMAFISSGSTVTVRTGAMYYSPNVWHCVHVEFQRDNATLKNRPYLYVNGRFDNCASSILGTASLYSDEFSTIRLGPNTNQLSSTGTDGTQLFLAEATYFRRNLTNKEKMLRANYGKMTTQGLRNEIIADSPKIYFPADNETQFPIEQAGDPTWGTSLTSSSAAYFGTFNVNQTGDRGKAWSFNSSTNNHLHIFGETGAKLKELMMDGTKSFSIEYYSLSPTRDPAVASNGVTGLIRIGRSATAGTGPIPSVTANTTTNNGSATSTAFIGRPSWSIDFWNGTAWQNSNTVLNFDVDISGSSQMNYTNYADGFWHQNIVTFERNGGTLIGRTYFDGFATTNRTFVTNGNAQPYADAANWALSQSLVNNRRFLIGTTAQPSTSYNRVQTMDNIAFYDYALSPEQIKQHYYAFSAQDPVPGTRIVRHWTGTEWVDSLGQKVWDGNGWVDWDAKRWDGTSWIAA